MPVLRDEPDTGEGRERAREAVVDAAEGGTCPEPEQDRAAQVPLVQPEPGHAQARPERMPLDADEAFVAALQTREHPDLIGTNGRRA